MNTKHFPSSIILFLLTASLISCTSENRFVICRISEYDCNYEHHVPGIITVTKGSSRLHYILTQKGLEKAEIKEGEPVAYNYETETVLVKETTDSSIDIFTVDTGNGKELSSKIPLKPGKTLSEKGKTFYAFPKLLSGCVQNDGTIALLVQHENLLSDSRINEPPYPEDGNTVSLYIYEKGDAKKLKRYSFPDDEPSESGPGDYFWEEPKLLQCIGKEIYLFSEKNQANEISLFYRSQPNWILGRIGFDSRKDDASIIDTALIAYDDITFNYYSKKDSTLYTSVKSSEKDKAILRITGLKEGYELPEEPIERENGDFLFSETPDGKPLIFFVKTRSHQEEQRIELLAL